MDHSWPLGFFTRGKQYLKQPIKPKRNTKKPAYKVNSSTQLWRSIGQKAGIVKSKINISKYQNTKMHAEIFAPIVRSYNPVSKQIVSRYTKPRFKDPAHCSRKNSKLNDPRTLNPLPKRDIFNYMPPNIKSTRNTFKPRYQIKIDTENSSEKDRRRPISAPTSFRNHSKPSIKNLKTLKRPKVEKKASESFKNLPDPVSKYQEVPSIQKPIQQQKKKRKNPEIFIEGPSKKIFLKCNSKVTNEINPQLFGSFSSSDIPENHLLRTATNTDRRIRNYFNKTARPNKFPLGSQIMNPMKRKPVPKLQSKQKTTVSGQFSANNLAYIKNRNLYCEDNIILEDEVEENIFDSNKQLKKNAPKQSNSNITDIEKNLNEVDNKIYNYEAMMSKDSLNEKEEISSSFTHNKATTEDLQAVLNDDEGTHESYSKEYQKSHRRSFFTVSMEESNDTSVYQTSNKELSGDDFLESHFSNERKPEGPNNKTFDVQIMSILQQFSKFFTYSKESKRDSEISEASRQKDISDGLKSPHSSTYSKIPEEERSDEQPSSVKNEHEEMANEEQISSEAHINGDKLVQTPKTKSNIRTFRKVESPKRYNYKKLVESEWRSLTTLNHFTSSSKALHFTKNIQIFSALNDENAPDSNVQLISEDSCHFQEDEEKSSQQDCSDVSKISADICHLTESPLALLEDTKKALEKLMMCINNATDLDDSLNDILKDLTELDCENALKSLASEDSYESITNIASSSVVFLKWPKFPDQESTPEILESFAGGKSGDKV